MLRRTLPGSHPHSQATRLSRTQNQKLRRKWYGEACAFLSDETCPLDILYKFSISPPSRLISFCIFSQALSVQLDSASLTSRTLTRLEPSLLLLSVSLVSKSFLIDPRTPFFRVEVSISRQGDKRSCRPKIYYGSSVNQEHAKRSGTSEKSTFITFEMLWWWCLALVQTAAHLLYQLPKF